MKNRIKYILERDVFGGIEYYKKDKVIIHLHKDLPFFASLFNWIKKHEEVHAQYYFRTGKKGGKLNRMIDLSNSFRILLHPVVLIEFILFLVFHPVLSLRLIWEECRFYITGKEISR